MNPTIVETLVDVRDRLAEEGPQYMPLAHAMHQFACEAAGYTGFTGVAEVSVSDELSLNDLMESILLEEVAKQINKQRRIQRKASSQRAVEQSRWDRLRAMLQEETTTVTPPPPPVESDGTDMCPAP